MNPLRDGAIDTTDGARLTYKARPGRDPWVLIHGLGCDASMWSEVIGSMPEDIGVVVPELRGHGGSTLGWRSPSVDLWAEDVERIVWAEQLSSPAIAGLSMGGYTALAVAHAFPKLARAFAFISTTAAPDDDPGRLRRAVGLATLHSKGRRDYAIGLMPKLLLESHSSYARHRDHLLAMFDRAGETGLASALWALASRPDRRESVAGIDVPVAVVHGSDDLLISPAAAEQLSHALTDAQLHVIPGTAHMSAMESPQDVARALLELEG